MTEHVMACPICHRTDFTITRDEEQGEYVLRCSRWHEIRRFFVFVPPPVPPRPERSIHAAQKPDPDR